MKKVKSKEILNTRIFVENNNIYNKVNFLVSKFLEKLGLFGVMTDFTYNDDRNFNYGFNVDGRFFIRFTSKYFFDEDYQESEFIFLVGNVGKSFYKSMDIHSLTKRHSLIINSKVYTSEIIVNRETKIEEENDLISEQKKKEFSRIFATYGLDEFLFGDLLVDLGLGNSFE